MNIKPDWNNGHNFTAACRLWRIVRRSLAMSLGQFPPPKRELEFLDLSGVNQAAYAEAASLLMRQGWKSDKRTCEHCGAKTGKRFPMLFWKREFRPDATLGQLRAQRKAGLVTKQVCETCTIPF